MRHRKAGSSAGVRCQCVETGVSMGFTDQVKCTAAALCHSLVLDVLWCSLCLCLSSPASMLATKAQLQSINTVGVRAAAATTAAPCWPVYSCAGASGEEWQEMPRGHTCAQQPPTGCQPSSPDLADHGHACIHNRADWQACPCSAWSAAEPQPQALSPEP